MAERNTAHDGKPSNNGNGLIEQLLARIDQLSEAISARPTTTVETEMEVRRTDSSQRAANRPKPYAASQYFLGQRPTNTRRAPQKGKGTNTVDNKPFMRDLILLSGPPG